MNTNICVLICIMGGVCEMNWLLWDPCRNNAGITGYLVGTVGTYEPWWRCPLLDICTKNRRYPWKFRWEDLLKNQCKFLTTICTWTCSQHGNRTGRCLVPTSQAQPQRTCVLNPCVESPSFKCRLNHPSVPPLLTCHKLAKKFSHCGEGPAW